VITLAERYERTLHSLETEVIEYEAKVKTHLAKMSPLRKVLTSHNNY